MGSAVAVQRDDHLVDSARSATEKRPPLIPIGPGVSRVIATHEDCRPVFVAAFRHAEQLINAGQAVWIVVRRHEEDRSLRQNAYYWGHVLPTISQQAMIGGQRWVTDAWHELAKREFLGYEVKKIQIAGRKRKHVIRRLRSTADLKVRAFSDYLEKLTAFAVTDLGVQFQVANWQSWEVRE